MTRAPPTANSAVLSARCPSSRRSDPVATFHTRTTPSDPPLTIDLPSSLYATPVTGPSSIAVAGGCQTRNVPSSPALTTALRDGHEVRLQRPTTVPLELAERGTALHIPDPHDAVLARRDDPAPVLAEADGYPALTGGPEARRAAAAVRAPQSGRARPRPPWRRGGHRERTSRRTPRPGAAARWRSRPQRPTHARCRRRSRSRRGGPSRRTSRRTRRRHDRAGRVADPFPSTGRMRTEPSTSGTTTRVPSGLKSMPLPALFLPVRRSSRRPPPSASNSATVPFAPVARQLLAVRTEGDAVDLVARVLDRRQRAARRSCPTRGRRRRPRR